MGEEVRPHPSSGSSDTAPETLDRLAYSDDAGGVCQWADRVGRRLTPLFRRWLDPNDTVGTGVSRALAGAHASGTAATYLSRALGIGTIVGVLFTLVGAVFGYVVFDTTVTAGLAGVSAGVLGGVGCAGGWLLRPHMRAAQRGREIDQLLPDAVAYAYALSTGGLDQLAVLEALAGAEDAYGAVSVEFQRVVSEMRYAGIDYRSALRRRAEATPSEALSAFIEDLIAVIDTGGRMEPFLRARTDRYRRHDERDRERRLETLELFGELYVTLSVFPLLLVIVLVVVATMGEPTTDLIFVTVYALIPLSGVGFLVLVAAVTRDEPGDGLLDAPRATHDERDWTASAESSRGAAIDGTALFARIAAETRRHRIASILEAPQDLLRARPHYSLLITLPIAAGLLAVVGGAGYVSVTPAAWVQRPVRSTAVWVYAPAAVVLGPLCVFTEWNRRTTRGVTDRLAETLRTLAAANETGQTLVESLRTVASGSTDPLARELGTVHAKVSHGMCLRTALVEFNNAYAEPRLARVVTLIADARAASSQVAAVLITAAETVEIHDDLERERRSHTRMQLTVIGVTFLTMLGVMAVLRTQLVGALGGLSPGSGATPTGVVGGTDASVGIAPATLTLVFFHAATVQAVVSGVVSGYLRDGTFRAGIPFVLAYGAITLGVWSVIG